MYYIIFGKYNFQNKPLNPNIKVYLWNRPALVALFAHKYLHHKPKSNLHNQDIFFLEKVKVYRLDTINYEPNGDVIMFDPTVHQNISYPEMEISSMSLNTFCDKLKTEHHDNNIVIQIISDS
jgi:hypothetical protein